MLSPGHTRQRSSDTGVEKRVETSRKRPVRTDCIRLRKYWPIALIFTVAFCIGINFGSDYKNYRHTGGSRAREPQTLVVYVFSETDTEYENNLRFFLRHGPTENDGCHYVFIMQESEGSKIPDIESLIPSNAQIEHHNNECYDWGTIGWLLTSGRVDVSAYKYFIFLNSSVRGPYLPVYSQGSKRWHEHMTDRITDKVKVVGATISCEAAYWENSLAGKARKNPHVQSYAIATDQVIMKLWIDNKKVFACWKNMWEVIWNGEVGSSKVALDAGYNIESFMTRYHGIDWRKESNWQCNAAVNPYVELHYDGISLNPYEVMFVKVKGILLGLGWTSMQYAVKYGHWMDQQVGPKPVDVSSNEWNSRTAALKERSILHSRNRGIGCFDMVYYLEHSPDLRTFPPAAAWEHFITMGQFEARPAKWICDGT